VYPKGEIDLKRERGLSRENEDRKGQKTPHPFQKGPPLKNRPGPVRHVKRKKTSFDHGHSKVSKVESPKTKGHS